MGHQDSHERSNSYHLIPNSAWLETRLFYVRISPCVISSVPDHLTLCHVRREIGVSLEINGSRVPASDVTSVALRRDRLDKESSEVTYVSTDSVRVTGSIEFEVFDDKEMVLCGSLERMESTWNNESDARTAGWSMDCYTAIGSGSSAFFQPKLGVSAPAIEVYIAGCCGGVPVILTKTIQVSPRRKGSRLWMLDAIPEDEEVEKDLKVANGVVRQRKLQKQMATIMSLMGKLERVSTLKTCIMGRMANFHGLMLVSELVLELA
ncbi:Erythronate-4-phosphate dehydrogenase family protein [Melia azedarach]|uniref:Erythronate-4-phosphate dehydrogenase family protein n=1 Tax=Melia azedarach TaxID=155640 RepID=A0ACC1YXN1_MELAZ|nr:Erythronate-4-phosphate dehydrogenase family protein [Melia azedarach]